MCTSEAECLFSGVEVVYVEFAWSTFILDLDSKRDFVFLVAYTVRTADVTHDYRALVQSIRSKWIRIDIELSIIYEHLVIGGSHVKGDWRALSISLGPVRDREVGIEVVLDWVATVQLIVAKDNHGRERLELFYRSVAAGVVNVENEATH